MRLTPSALRRASSPLGVVGKTNQHEAAPAGLSGSAGAAGLGSGKAEKGGKGGSGSRRGRNALVLLCVAAAWLALDQLTKAFFNGGSFQLGEHIAGPFLGLFRFTLVHNTGAAWGMFGGSTLALGVLSLGVCALLLAYLLVLEPEASLAQAVGLALVVAGGIGNAIDRFAQGYVVDFIDFAFMDFPVFNVADIGVTCGFVLFFCALLWDMRREGESGAARAGEGMGSGSSCEGAAGRNDAAARKGGKDGEGSDGKGEGA